MRFPGFEDEWEEKMFGELATNKSTKYNPKNSIGSVKCIELEHVDGGSGQILGYIDGSQTGSIKNVFKKGDVLFGKLRPYLRKYTLAPFDGVCSSEIWVLTGTTISNDFLYRLVQTEKFIDLANQSSGSKMPRADWSLMEKGIFYFPSQAEQRKIAKFLSLLDERIATQNKIIEDFRALKQIMIKKLFSRQLQFKDPQGKNFPDWRETKLGDLTEVVSIRNKNNEKLPVYSINNKSGFVPQNEQFEGINSDERGYDIKMYKVIGKNTFAYNPARINVGSIGYSGELENVIISSLYVCFKTNESINDQFLFQYLKTDFFSKEVTKNVEGGVRDYLFYDNFARIKIYIPNIKEQSKIANVLSELDEKIAIEVSILRNFQNQKMYFFQKLFI